MSDNDKLGEQARNEKANGEALGNPDAVRAAEKRLAALGDHETAAEPVEAKPVRARQTKR